MASIDHEDDISSETLKRMRIMSRKLLQVVPTELSEDAQSWCNQLVKAIIRHHRDPTDQLAMARTLHFNLKKNGQRLAKYAPGELAQLSPGELCQGTNTQLQRERAQLGGWNHPPKPKSILATNEELSGWVEEKTRKLVLILNNKGNHQAFKEYFEGIPRVEVVHGDILDNTVGYYDAMVSPANTMGNMDGGIDRVYANFLGWGYGRPYDQPNPLQIAIDNHAGEENARLDIGQGILVRSEKKHLIAAPTMALPSKIKVNSTIVRDATLAAFQVWRQYSDIKTIRMPSFGTGYGQVPGVVAAAQTLEAFVLAWRGKRERES
mmetsp:Transcript_16352/g.39925  ORF Transcript_16352/g.39925 Transcript_16352/m.39925 type:complete len:321 (+) Transcript_16352:91-1053(+)